MRKGQPAQAASCIEGTGSMSRGPGLSPPSPAQNPSMAPHCHRTKSKFAFLPTFEIPFSPCGHSLPNHHLLVLGCSGTSQACAPNPTIPPLSHFSTSKCYLFQKAFSGHAPSPVHSPHPHGSCPMSPALHPQMAGAQGCHLDQSFPT